MLHLSDCVNGSGNRDYVVVVCGSSSETAGTNNFCVADFLSWSEVLS